YTSGPKQPVTLVVLVRPPLPALGGGSDIYLRPKPIIQHRKDLGGYPPKVKVGVLLASQHLNPLIRKRLARQRPGPMSARLSPMPTCPTSTRSRRTGNCPTSRRA